MRLFVAINMPAAERERLSAELQRVTERHPMPVRWLAADTLHITLKFLGEVKEPNVPSIKAALAVARAIPRFDLNIGGFGAFPSKSRPNIFWVGVEPVAELNELHRRVDVAYEELGFASEDRAYHPHITVGRAQKDAQIRDRGLMDRITGEFEYKAVLQVQSIELMRSHTGRGGARYEVLEGVELQ